MVMMFVGLRLDVVSGCSWSVRVDDRFFVFMMFICIWSAVFIVLVMIFIL